MGTLAKVLFDEYRFELDPDAESRWSDAIREAYSGITSEELVAAIRFAASQRETRATRNTISVRDVRIWIAWFRKHQRQQRDGYKPHEPMSDDAVHAAIRAAQPRQRWDIIMADENDEKRRRALLSWALAAGIEIERPVWPKNCERRYAERQCPLTQEYHMGQPLPNCPACELVRFERVEARP